MGKPLSQEIDRFGITGQWASDQETKEIHRLIIRWSNGPLIVVGSGGSYSAAEAWAQLHRTKVGKVALPSTPYQLEKYLTELEDCRVLLLSAEGKNADVLNAARIARQMDAPCAALTLTQTNALLDYVAKHRSAFSFSFDFDCKDGYLATNSLVATILLAVKTYCDADEFQLALTPIESVATRRQLLTDSAAIAGIHARGALVLHGPDSALFAVDMESKLTEAALSACQIADYRQFAHGRHLQLTKPAAEVPVVMYAYTEAELPLAKATLALFPEHVEVCGIPIAGTSYAQWAVASAIESILVTEAVGRVAGVDPGQPIVPDFGRQIYSLKLSSFQPASDVPQPLAIAVKRKLRGAHSDRVEPIEMAARSFLDRLGGACFRAVVFDFDGTLCHAHQRFSGINEEVAAALVLILDAGLVIGIATGRGDSVIESLRTHIPEKFWEHVLIGPYSGSFVMSLDADFACPSAHAEFPDVLACIKDTALHHSLKGPPKQDGFQMGFRIDDHTAAADLVHVLEDWIARTGRKGWRVYSSGHSVDLLAPEATKLNVVTHIQKQYGISPDNEILRIGDAGEHGGNDMELLSGGLGLSVESVSCSLTSCWNFAPVGMRQADATLYYLRHLELADRHARLKLNLSAGEPIAAARGAE